MNRSQDEAEAPPHGQRPGYVLTVEQRAFAAAQRRAILATLSPSGQPRLVPICFVLTDAPTVPASTLLYSPLDEKPKRSRDVHELARVRDITERPDVTLLFERWSEDWTQLAWLRARGQAHLLEPDQDPATHRDAVAALREKHPQYQTQRIDTLPLVSIAITEAVEWLATPRAAPDTPRRPVG